MGWAPIITMTIIGTILGFRVWLIPRTPQAKQEHLARQAKKRLHEQTALAGKPEPQA